jgi:hypothetical protein
MKRVALVLGFFVLCAGVQAQVSVFSTGEGTPETISLVGEGFDHLRGSYLVPDFLNGNIWSVPRNGGTPSVFVAEPGFTRRGGLFLPRGWGNLRGQFLVAGDQPIANNLIQESIRVYDSSGQGTDLLTNYTGDLTSPILADNDFMHLRNNVLIGDEVNGLLLAVAPNHTIRTVATGLVLPFGLANSPYGFGRYDDAVFYSSDLSGNIGIVDRHGNVSVFATITPAQGLQANGLRQIAFAPYDWLRPIGIHGIVLLVSLADSNGNTQTGIHGSILALNSQGKVVASFKKGPTDKFDPRGMLFMGDQDRDDGLLVSDATHNILKLGPRAFQPVISP